MNAELLDRQSSASAVTLEETACSLCGDDGFDPVMKGHVNGRVFHVVKCHRCGLHFTNPRPTRESIGHCYPPQYRPHAGKAHHERALRSWYPLDWLQPPWRDGRRPRLLDFGCGAGHFLAAMDRAGWEVAGLDVSRLAIKTIREELGLLAFVGSLPHPELEAASFDCIAMWHALEHVHDPLGIVREAKRLLVPGGCLIVAVPNFAGWSRRHFGESWFGLDLPRHLTHFEPATLTRLLESAGMRIGAVRFCRHADWIRASAQRAGSGLANWMLRNRQASSFFSHCLRAKDGDALMFLAQRVL